MAIQVVGDECMDKIIRRLYLIESIAARLGDLLEHRAIPKESEKQLLEEQIALQWALKEIREKYLTDVLLLVGDEAYVRTFCWLEDRISEVSGSIATCIEFAPDRLVVDKTRSEIAPNWEGATLPAGKTPTWLVCSRYYASCLGGDRSKRMVLFDCSVPKMWLEETGSTAAKAMLSPWMVGLFNAMRWDDAKEIKP